jgi:hypothetical protein
MEDSSGNRVVLKGAGIPVPIPMRRCDNSEKAKRKSLPCARPPVAKRSFVRRMPYQSGARPSMIQIEQTVAISVAGLLAQLEVLRENFGEHALIDTIIVGVKALVPAEALR